jgi:hypothetical protein
MAKFKLYFSLFICFSAVAGFAYMIWTIGKPGFSFWESVLSEVAVFGTIAFYMAWLSIPGCFCTKVVIVNK